MENSIPVRNNVIPFPRSRTHRVKPHGYGITGPDGGGMQNAPKFQVVKSNLFNDWLCEDCHGQNFRLKNTK